MLLYDDFGTMKREILNMTGFRETDPNHILEVMRKSILKILNLYNQPRIMNTQMKLAQKVDQFTAIESTSCC